MASGRGRGVLALATLSAQPDNNSSRGLFGESQSSGSADPEIIGGGSEEKKVMEELSVLLEEIQSEEAQQGNSGDPATSVQIPGEANVWADLYERYSLYRSFLSVRSINFRSHGCHVRGYA